MPRWALVGQVIDRPGLGPHASCGHADVPATTGQTPVRGKHYQGARRRIKPFFPCLFPMTTHMTTQRCFRTGACAERPSIQDPKGVHTRATQAPEKMPERRPRTCILRPESRPLSATSAQRLSAEFPERVQIFFLASRLVL